MGVDGDGTATLLALCFDANDPGRLARFWAAVLGWERAAGPDGEPALLPDDDTGFGVRFRATRERRTGPNPLHLDLTSRSLDDQRETVDRALRHGAEHLDVGQLPQEGHVVLADPEGNAFCVIEPGNAFLAGCGFLGAVACDGSPRVGYFWSAALGWPLVWDQDQETAIRSPHGGPKISWGGSPPTTGVSRLHFDLAAPAGDDGQAAVERLLSLGATRQDGDAGETGQVTLADPDGNEFCLFPPAPGRG